MNEQSLLIEDRAESLVISSRRRFLKTMACASLLALGLPEQSEAKLKRHHPKALAIHNINTGDSLKLTYFEKGKYVKDALKEINYLFRDFHTGASHPIDPALLDQLYDLKTLLRINKPFHLVSGYRSPVTNAKLRRHNHTVAKHSLHMEGRAIDIWIEGVETRVLRNAALTMKRGGVGYYPRANFVHLDTGDVRTWTA